MSIEVAKAIGWTRVDREEEDMVAHFWVRPDGEPTLKQPTYTVDDLLVWLRADRPKRLIAIEAADRAAVDVSLAEWNDWDEQMDLEHFDAPTLLEALERAVLAVAS